MKEIILGNYKIILADTKASLYKNNEHVISLNSAVDISLSTFLDFIINPPVRPTVNSSKEGY